MEPAVHAEPLDTATPAISKLIKNDSTSVPGKVTFNTCGSDALLLHLLGTKFRFV